MTDVTKQESDKGERVMGDSKHEDFARVVGTVIRDMVKLKGVMLSRKLRAAKAVCPECGGMLQGRLVGRKNHMRMWCEGTCNRQMME